MTYNSSSGVPKSVVVESDCRTIPLEDRSIHVVLGSPPYWDQRDYKNEGSIWRGYAGCSHVFDKKGFCKKCDAWKGPLGNEPTQEQYIQNLQDCFREVKRVLRDDGVIWLVIADTHSGGQMCGIPGKLAEALKKDGWILRHRIPWFKRNGLPQSADNRVTMNYEDIFMFAKSDKPLFWTHKNGIARRTRPPNDIAYRHYPRDKRGKPYVGEIYPILPISNPKLIKLFWKTVTTWESHHYWYSRQAALMPLSKSTVPRYLRGYSQSNKYSDQEDGYVRHTLQTASRESESSAKYINQRLAASGSNNLSSHSGNHTAQGKSLFPLSGRNRRASDYFFDQLNDLKEYLEHVIDTIEGERLFCDMNGDPVALVVNTKAYKGAHFAAFPKLLVEWLLKPTLPPCVCMQCGAPFYPIYEEEDAVEIDDYQGNATKDYEDYMAQDPSETKRRINRSLSKRSVCKRIAPTCNCRPVEKAFPVVLDPFGGHGTTGTLAYQMRYDFIGTEVNPEYVKSANDRISREGLGLDIQEKDGERSEQIVFF